jgi:hypothetical protein
LTAQQLIKAEIEMIELQPNTNARHQESGEPERNVRSDGYHHGLSWRVGPRPWWNCSTEPVGQVLNDLYAFCARSLGQRPRLLRESMARTDCASWSAMRIAAHADVTGVTVRDVAIKIARMTRKRYREGVPCQG